MAKRMTNRQLAALETRRRLLEAAGRLVREKGLVNTSVEEIAKASGVSNGTFYTYFKRKEDVVFALSQEMYQGIYEEAQAHDGPFMERLAFYLVNFSGHVERDGLKLCQEWVRNTVDPDLVETPYDKDKLQVDVDSMRGMINQGIERGELEKGTPVEALANALVDVIYGEMLCWDMSGGTYSFEERTREFCDLFLPSMMRPYISRGPRGIEGSGEERRPPSTRRGSSSRTTCATSPSQACGSSRPVSSSASREPGHRRMRW